MNNTNSIEYEVFVSKTRQNRTKKYIVSKTMGDAIRAGMKVFKASDNHILCQVAWKVGDSLYFEEPHKKRQKKVYAASYCRYDWIEDMFGERDY